jgi:hypothetical protein
VRLCSADRVLRLQRFGPGLHQHFHLFSMTSAGRAAPAHRFELGELSAHLDALLGLVEGVRAAGRPIRDVRVRVADATDNRGRLERVSERVFRALAARWPDVKFGVDHDRTHGRGYYDGLMLDVTLDAGAGLISVADGGTTDWAGRLLADRRERLFTSGVGLERLIPQPPED